MSSLLTTTQWTILGVAAALLAIPFVRTWRSPAPEGRSPHMSPAPPTPASPSTPRVRRPKTRRARLAAWLVSRRGQVWLHRLPTMAVLLAGAYGSFVHQYALARAHHADVVLAILLPIATDGLMINGARYVTHSKGPVGRAWAYITFLAGMAATLGGNFLAAEPTPVGYAIATWSAVAVILTAGTIHWADRKRRPVRKAPARAPQAAHARRSVPAADTSKGGVWATA